MKPLHILVVFTILFMSNFDSYSTQSLCTELGVITSQMKIFDSDIQQLLYAKEDRSEMYVRTEEKIYHTNDTGFTWTDVTSLIPGYYNTTLSASNGKYGVSGMTTAHDSIVYLQGYGYVFWMTRDGTTFKKQETYPNYLYSIKPHPTDYQYALRLIYVSSLRYFQLQLSDQGGMGDSWAPVKDNVTSYTWGGLHDQIYAIGMPDGSSAWNGSESRFFIFNLETYNTVSLGYESDPGYTAMLFTENVLYIGKQSTDPKYLDLFLSADFGSTFSPAIFTNPQNQQVNTTKYFVESSNEQVSMIVSTLPTNSHIGDLYTADVSDGQYTISLSNIVANSYSTDIQEIYALRGTFFANTYNITEEERNNPNAVIDDKIRSAITFDKGGVWLPISVINSSCSLEDKCPLNLFSYTEYESSSLRSTNYSVGVVLGTGNEGTYRKPVGEEANLYLSRNGGYSFDMVRSGIWDYSSAAHSSLLLISSWEEELNSISFSWDQGENWSDCVYVDPTLSALSGYSNVTLDAIRSVGQITDTKFLLIGDVQNNDNATDIRTVIISFDFSQLQIPCEGYDIPGQEGSDYEVWTPETTSSCSLGVKTSYVRRKRSSPCYSPHDETPSSPVTCPCTRSDYTCDGECWEERREGGETVCVNICVNTPYDPQLPPSPCIGSYSVSQGYRKVEGDQCDGGDSDLYEPITLICPSVSSTPTPSFSLSPSFTPSATTTQSFSPSVTPSVVCSPSATPEPSFASTPVPQSEPSHTSSSNIVTSGVSSDGDDNNDNNDNGGDNNGLVIGLTILSVLIILILLFIILIILIILYKTNSRVRNILTKCLPSRCKEVDEKKLYSVLGEETDFDNSLTAHFTELEETSSSPVSNNSSILSPLPVLFKPDEN